MAINAADDGEAIRARIKELERERGDRQHEFEPPSGLCKHCQTTPHSFAATRPCPGNKDEG